MRNSLRIALFTAAALACGCAAAEPAELAPELDACLEKNSSTFGMRDCYERAAKHQDKLLNANYKAAMAGCSNAPDPGACKNRLRTAERAWIGYRDAMQAYILASGEGSLRHVIAAEFLASETAKQARYLNATQN